MNGLEMFPFEAIGLGMNLALSPEALYFCLIGVLIGTLVGVIPGVGILPSISMLIPLTYTMSPAVAIMMLAGIYYGAAYGGSTASILLNLPGTASNAVTCLDGYPMTLKGKAGVALFITTIASFIGSVSGIIVLMVLTMPLASVALHFGSYEYFSLLVLVIFMASSLTSGSFLKSVIMILFGIQLGLVGIDVNSGVARFTFGLTELFDGLSIIALALALFGFPEMIYSSAMTSQRVTPGKVRFRDMLPSRQEWRESMPAMLRGGGLGTLMGALPGTGTLVASFAAYGIEKRVSKTPERFGKGAIEGVSAPESANNAAIPTAFIPTLSLGIPGDAVMAVILGVLMIHGITPGPQFLTNNQDMFWALIISFFIANIFLLVINIPFINLWAKISIIPTNILSPNILIFMLIGVFSYSFLMFDIIIFLFLGLISFGLYYLKFSPSPLILGFIIGPIMEENFRRSMLLAGGDITVFFQRPMSAGFLIVALLLLLFSAYRTLRGHASKTDVAAP